MKELVWHRQLLPSCDRHATAAVPHRHGDRRHHDVRRARVPHPQAGQRDAQGARPAERRPLRGALAEQRLLRGALPRRHAGGGCRQPAQPALRAARADPRAVRQREPRGVRRPGVRAGHRPDPRLHLDREGRAARRGRRAARPRLRGAAGLRRRGGPRGARGGRRGDAAVHRRHDGSAEGRAAHPAGDDAHAVPHPHERPAGAGRRLPRPGADVPRGLDGRDPRHARRPATGWSRCRSSTCRPCWTPSRRRAARTASWSRR